MPQNKLSGSFKSPSRVCFVRCTAGENKNRTPKKHFTIDKDLPGRDNKFALDAKEFKEMCRNINIASDSIIDKGNGYQSIEEDTVMNYRGRWEPQDYS